MGRRFIQILFTGLLCFHIPILYAQRYPFYNFKIEQGLIQSQSTSITQDSFGNIWVGTIGGLSRFDGHSVRNYTLNDGLASNMILDVFYSDSKKLFVSTGKGLQFFDGEYFKKVLGPDNKVITGVNNMQEAGNNLFFICNGYIYRLQHGSVQAKLCDTIHAPYTCLYYDGDRLWAADMKGGIYNYAIADVIHPADSLYAGALSGNLLVLSFLRSADGTMWLLTSSGLYYAAGNRIKAYEINGKPAIDMPLVCGAEDANHQLWFGSLRGAFSIFKNQVHYYNQAKGLSDNTIYDLKTDMEGNVWFCTDGDGIFRYSGGPFMGIDNDLGPYAKQVTGITGGPDSTIFFSTYQGFLYHYRFADKAVRIATEDLKGIPVFAISYQSGKGLWVATRFGLYLYRNNRFNTVRFDVRKSLSAMYLASSDTLFVVSHRQMFKYYNAKCVDSVVLPAEVECIAGLSPDSIVIAHRSGFSLYVRGRLYPLSRPALLDGVQIQSMVFAGGMLYCATNDRGIFQMDMSGREVDLINTRDGLSSDFIYNLIKDSKGQLWAGTGKGICKIIPGIHKPHQIEVYLKEHGVTGLESNSNAAFADAQGRLWFGTTEGLSCFIPDVVPTLPRANTIILESVHLFGGRPIDSAYYKKKVGWYHIPDGLVLPYRYNGLSFTFRAISQCPVNKILYSYRLDKAQTTWSEWSEENTINLSALEPGTYTLNVICAINGVVQKHAKLQYTFVIRTPFHKSSWFVISILVMAISGGVLLQYYANKRKQNRKRKEEQLRREEQNRVRERTAEDFHDEVGNKLTRINVLTSVLKTKLPRDNDDAARIIRQIQENTAQLYAGTRDILWSLKPSNDNLFEILNHVTELANEMFSETDIHFSMSGNDPVFKQYKMPLDKSRNFIMIWKEALNNCMKYASAQTVLFQVQQHTASYYMIRLVDDGVGFDMRGESTGNGLKNMAARARRLDGRIEVLSAPGKGTQVVLYIPKQN